MTGRERMAQAFAHAEPDRVPVWEMASLLTINPDDGIKRTVRCLVQGCSLGFVEEQFGQGDQLVARGLQVADDAGHSVRFLVRQDGVHEHDGAGPRL